MDDRTLVPLIERRLAKIQDRIKHSLPIDWKTETYGCIIVYRMMARAYIEQYNTSRNELQRLTRYQRKLAESGASFVILDAQVKRLKNLSNAHLRRIATVGHCIFEELDKWEAAGATLQDLCDLCAVPYHKALQMIKPERCNEPFSGIIFVYNLDFKDEKADFLTMDIDAPLTHSINEYMIDQMLHNPEVKQASRQALEECFPDLMDKAFFPYTDQDGRIYLVDKDGLPIEPDSK